MPKVSVEHQNQRRSQIIDAAVRCIAKKGFRQTSMQDIVAESGLSPGAIYLYFKSKEEIIKTVADMRHEKEREIITKAFATGDARIALNRLVEDFLDSLADENVRMERTIGVQLGGEALSNPVIRKIVRQGIDESKNVLAEALTAYQKQGKLSPHLSPESVARAMLAQFQGFLLQIALDDTVDIKEYVKVIKHWISVSASKETQLEVEHG